MATSTVTIVVEAQDKTGGVFDRVAGSVQTLGVVALAGIGSLAASAGAAGAAMIAFAASAEPLVGLQNGFAATTERIGSSSEQMLAALQDASGGLITNRDLMTSFNKAAALVGDDFAQTLPDAMGLVQRAAQATGQDFGFLMDSLVTGVGRVSPMILDNLGIQVSLAEVTEHAAEMFGKQAEELTKTEQQMALNEIVLGKLTDAYGDIETAAQPIAQIRTMFANLRDEVGLRLLPAVLPLAETFVDLAQRALPMLFNILDGSIVPVVTGVAEAISNLITNLLAGVDPIDALSLMVAEIGRAFGLSETAVDEFRVMLTTLIDATMEVVGTIQSLLTPVMAAVAGFLSWKDVAIGLAIAIASVVIPALLPIIGTIAAVIATAAALSLAIAALRKAWETNFLGIQDKTRAVMVFVQDLITTVVGAIRTFWEQNGAAILANARQTWETIQTVISTVINVIQTIITTVANAIGAAWDRHGASILAAAQNFWSAIRDFIAREIANIKDIITNIANGIKAFWDDHGAAIVAGARQAWGFIQDIIDTSFSSISTLFDTFAALFSGDWDAFGRGLLDLWQASIDNIVAAFGAIWSFIQPILSGMWSDLSGWFTGKVSDFAAIGSNLITSLANAIRDRANSYLKTAAQGVANLLPDWVRRLLGISSPSTVFRNIGHNVVIGLVQGIYDKYGTLENSINTLFGFLGTFDGIASTIGDIFESRTVQPLRDHAESLADYLENSFKDIQEQFDDLGINVNFAALSDEQSVRMMNQLRSQGYTQLANQIYKTMEAEERRSQLLGELMDKEQTLLDIEKQQQDLQLLQAQQQLLNLIRENNLSTSILDGLELGINADLQAILEATSQAMQELINTTEVELGIASPSKKFMEIGHQIMAGLQRGITRGSQLLRVQPSVNVGLPGLTSGGLRSLINTPTTTHNYYLNANYQYQRESDIVSDLRVLGMLRG